jgi:small subunit ribosomal protein S9
MAEETRNGNKEMYYATGRRKESVAKVWVEPGSGEFRVNGGALPEYFKRKTLEVIIAQPLELTDTKGKVNIRAKVLGGGIAGQAGALRLGIAKALVRMDEKCRPPLRTGGLLTRDPRMVERKKYGQRGARARFQFTKR